MKIEYFALRKNKFIGHSKKRCKPLKMATLIIDSYFNTTECLFVCLFRRTFHAT